ncbi:MAG: hypothetical protein QCH35_02960 [Methanomicrobiaceae archaeon]|nr:hypothetical protein [Methanomicrobiaceae archaeon]
MTRERAMHVIYSLQGLVLLFSLVMFITGDLGHAASAAFVFAVTLIPYALEQRHEVVFEPPVYLAIFAAVYLHGLGDLMGFYDDLHPFFDKIAHVTSAGIITILALVLVLLLDRYNRHPLEGRIIFIGIVSMTIALGAIWEVAEFAVDNILATNLQLGLDDTMLDLCFDIIGALVAGTAGYLYLATLPRKQLEGRFFQERGVPNLPADHGAAEGR